MVWKRWAYIKWYLDTSIQLYIHYIIESSSLHVWKVVRIQNSGNFTTSQMLAFSCKRSSESKAEYNYAIRKTVQTKHTSLYSPVIYHFHQKKPPCQKDQKIFRKELALLKSTMYMQCCFKLEKVQTMLIKRNFCKWVFNIFTYSSPSEPFISLHIYQKCQLGLTTLKMLAVMFLIIIIIKHSFLNMTKMCFVQHKTRNVFKYSTLTWHKRFSLCF